MLGADRRRGVIFPAHSAVSVLNEALALDPAAVTALVGTRVACNAQLRDHPSIQVWVTPQGNLVGLLGIINGIVGSERDGFIFADFDAHERIVRFRVGGEE